MTLLKDPAMTKPSPSEVRTQMLTECESLRIALDELARMAAHEPHKLVAGIVELRDRLRTYLRHEQELLLPALEATEHGGPGRLARMRAAHAAHFMAVEELARAAVRPDADLGKLAPVVARLRSSLRRDLDDDERCLLVAEVLQDDASSTDQTDG